ncbi:MAG TPA: DNA polymerase/3'-5' exonuclease PolX [Baekduia sp.]|nr:DNA polymerase/3'-5' exonuclease PolX [Baekduia sp.]
MATDPTNTQIAEAFDELADLYELDGAIVHRVLAYRTAAKVVREAPSSVAALARAGKATQLKGIGATLEEKIVALIEDGVIPSTAKLRAKYPAGLVAITRLPGVGAKRVRRLYDEAGIDSLEALKTAAEAGKLSELKGFGAKFEQQVLESIAAGVADAPRTRVLLDRAIETGEAIVDFLRAQPAAVEVELAGGARRRADSVKDLDIVVSSDDPAALIKALGTLDLIESASTDGTKGARAMTHSGIPIDLRIVPPAAFGNLLQHFTGSKHHNETLRTQAVKKGLHVSEYGILDDATGETTTCRTEAEVYELLGLPYIEPELREDRGELDPGFTPPELITVADLKGDLHCHTTASDGRNSIEEMARGALDRGYEYICITDHSATHGFGDEVSPDQLKRQIEKVRKADAAIDGIKILIGTESNILPNGLPDYDDELLQQLDWVVCSIHTNFRTKPAEMTKRIVTAIEHPLVDEIGHPTGRLIGRREPYDFDMEAVIAAAARTNTCLEINGNVNRRDLNETHARAAVAGGVKLVINSDAHGADTQYVIKWGVATARRAWITKDDVANTRSWPELQKLRGR